MSEVRSDLQRFREWIESLSGVTKVPHWFGGTEYQVQGMEFMHSHGDAHLDVRLSKEDQARVLAEGKAERHQFAPEAGWVTVKIRSARDLEYAKEVVLLAYTRARSIMEDHLARRKASNIIADQ